MSLKMLNKLVSDAIQLTLHLNAIIDSLNFQNFSTYTDKAPISLGETDWSLTLFLITRPAQNNTQYSNVRFLPLSF